MHRIAIEMKMGNKNPLWAVLKLTHHITFRSMINVILLRFRNYYYYIFIKYTICCCCSFVDVLCVSVRCAIEYLMAHAHNKTMGTACKIRNIFL